MTDQACAGCNGRCCYDVAVGITGFDAWRIATAHALPFAAFVTVASTEAGERGAFRLCGSFAALVLQRSAAIGRACAFLLHLPGGERRCGTYVSRPTVCRTYPMTVAAGVTALRSDVACPPGAWNAGAIASPSWRAASAAYDAEWERYARAILAWNASAADGLDAYLAYVFAVYDGLAASSSAPERVFAEALVRVTALETEVR